MLFIEIDFKFFNPVALSGSTFLVKIWRWRNRSPSWKFGLILLIKSRRHDYKNKIYVCKMDLNLFKMRLDSISGTYVFIVIFLSTMSYLIMYLGHWNVGVDIEILAKLIKSPFITQTIISISIIKIAIIWKKN